MMKLLQKQLEFSMHLDKSSNCLVRFAGKCLGAYPVWYAERLERKLLKNDKIRR
jgi:hypothetical protein